MLIILEGPDGTGKTTSAKRLEELIHERLPGDRVVQMHKGPPTTSNWLDEYLEPLVTYTPMSDEHFILDRWHWGEKVYPTLWDRPSLFTHPSEWWYFDAFLRSRGAVVVLFDGSATYHAARVVERALANDEANVPDPDQLAVELEAQADLFTKAANTSRVDQIYSFTGKPLNQIDQTLHIAINLASSLESAVSRLVRDHPTYVGPRKSSHLILGDRRGPGRRDIPVAFAPLRGTSGYFLLRALPTLGLTNHEVGVANACEDEDIDDLLELLGHPKVIALGREAAHETRHLQRATMPHPQFVRRFHHIAQRRYGEAIVEALEEQKEWVSWRP